MTQSNEFFATEKPLRLFLKVALPGLVSMLAMSLYQAFEGAFVGKLIGEAAFAAINIGFPIVMINNSLADMVGVGSSVPISVALGRKEGEEANNVFTCSIILITLMAVVTGLLIYFTAPFFTRLMGATGELADLAIRYVRIYALFGPFTNIVFAMDNYLRISGYVKGSMYLNIFMSVLTVIFLALFLGVFNMNVEGSALATLLAMFICAILAFIPFVRNRAILSFRRPRFSLSLIRKIVTYGAPTFLNNIAGRVTSILMNAALIRLGGQTAVAAYSVLMYAAGVIEPMLYGMSDSTQPAVGYNWGAGKLDRVRDITKSAFLIIGLISILCTFVMWFFPAALANLFIAESDVQLMALTLHAIPIYGTAFLFGWFGFAVQGFFAAIEKPLPATILSVCRAMVFPVILIYALGFMGLDGLWLNYTGTALMAIFMAIIMLLRTQKTMKRDIARYRTNQTA